MKTVNEIRTGIGFVAAIHVVMTFGVMGLLVRMSPAIERVLEQNVTSMGAVEDMYSVVAQRDCGLSPVAADQRFETALHTARDGVSVAGEGDLLDNVEKNWPPALEGDCDARVALDQNLQELSDINRLQVEVADEDTKLLGNAGTWAAALLGLISFGAGMALTARFTRRIAEPFTEIESVLSAAGKGDPYRRCRRLEAPAEYHEIATRLNQFLDRRLAQEETEDPQLSRLDRVLLLHLLDRMKEPALAVDTSGAIIAASDRALDVLAGSGIDSLSDALAVGPGSDDGMSLIRKVEPIGKGEGFLITLSPLEPVREEGAPPPPSEPAPPAPVVPIVDPLADKGAADTAEPVPPSEPPADGKPDWERD